MSHISIKRAHHSTVADARKTADKVAAKLAKDYDLRSNWEGDVLHFDRSRPAWHAGRQRERHSGGREARFADGGVQRPDPVGDGETQLDGLNQARRQRRKTGSSKARWAGRRSNSSLALQP